MSVCVCAVIVKTNLLFRQTELKAIRFLIKHNKKTVRKEKRWKTQLAGRAGIGCGSPDRISLIDTTRDLWETQEIRCKRDDYYLIDTGLYPVMNDEILKAI